MRVNIPQYRFPGETAQLQCEYDLGNDTLYSVKWYKDHEEFYRWVPKAHPRATGYNVEGIILDVSINIDQKTYITDLFPITSVPLHNAFINIFICG